MEDEPSSPKSNHKEDSNPYKAPCYDRLLIAYSPRTSLTTSSHLTPVSLCGIQCLYWVLYGHPYLAVRPRGGLTRRYRRCGLTSRQQTIFNADRVPYDVFLTVLMQLNLPLLPLVPLLLVPLLVLPFLLLVALPLIL